MDELTEKKIVAHVKKQQDDAIAQWEAQEKARHHPMSVTWDSGSANIDVRPAGDGPLMQEFYAEVAKAMRDQHERALTELMFSDRVNRAQRGPQWRVWVHAFLLGMAGGALGAVIVWIANHGV